MPATRSNASALRSNMSFSQRMQRKRSILIRIFKSGCVNFVRNAWLSIAAIAMMVITLTIILLSVILNQTFRNTIAQITDRIDVSVYLKDEVSPRKTEDFLNEIRRLQNVKEVEYLDKNEVYEGYVLDNKDDPAALAAVSLIDNPFPATVRIKPKDPNDLESIRRFLETTESKELQSDKISYSEETKEAIDNITRTAKFVTEVGLVAVLIFAAVSVMIIFNTIQMAIFNRREELAIMQLLGATKRYIQGSFLVEAFLYGIISGLISVLLVNILLQVQTSVFDATSSGIVDITYAVSYLGDNFIKLLAMQLSLGVGIAVLSATFATRRHLRKKH